MKKARLESADEKYEETLRTYLTNPTEDKMSKELRSIRDRLVAYMEAELS